MAKFSRITIPLDSLYNRPRLESLKKKHEEKKHHRESVETSRKELAQKLKEEDPDVGRQESQRFMLDNLQKKEAELKKEEKELSKLVDNLQKKCVPLKLDAYYATSGSMLHIVAAKAKGGKFKIRINYIGQTIETEHCRCERVSSILHGIRCKHAHQLPQTSDDFKVRDALYWRCAATRMLRLDDDKCLCEYGIQEGSTFEHDIEKLPMSKQARSQMANIKGKSKLKAMIGDIRAQRSSSQTHKSGSPNFSKSVRSISSTGSLRSNGTSTTAETENQDVLPRSSSPARSIASSTSSKFEVSVDMEGSHKKLPMHDTSKESAVLDAQVALLKQKEREAVKEMKRAQKEAQKVNKLLQEAESKRQAAEAAASRAQSSAHLLEHASHWGAQEIETARRAQRAAEVALRKNTKATFTALNAKQSMLLPRIENATVRAEPACVICLDNEAVVMAYPCGHRCYCESCGDERRTELAALQETCNGGACKCPVCRDDLDDLVRVF